MTDEMKYVLYLAVNQVNEKKYVGFTGKKLVRRKYQHEHEALRKNSQKYFHRAIRKYGSEFFKWYVIGWSADVEDIKSQEVVHIKFYKSLGGKLYNMTDGGDGHTNPTPEVRAKMFAQGRINGLANVASGHLARVRELPQSAAARRRNVESGHLARIRELPQTKAAQRATGRISGRKAVESGQLASICAMGGRVSNHKRNHVLRNIVKLDCILCNPTNQISTQAVAA
jgi:hypothetical protein